MVSYAIFSRQLLKPVREAVNNLQQ
jgi:hypothetical protein